MFIKYYLCALIFFILPRLSNLDNDFSDNIDDELYEFFNELSSNNYLFLIDKSMICFINDDT